MKMEFTDSSKNYKETHPQRLYIIFTTVRTSYDTLQINLLEKQSYQTVKTILFFLFSQLTIMNKTIIGTQVLYRTT